MIILCLAAASCEKADLGGDTAQDGNVTLNFVATQSDRPQTRAVSIGDCFTKLNIMLFNADGEKVLDKVRTQTSSDDGFGQVSLSLAAGTYSIVAVGHSSIKSATIKSTEMVQFTASNGEKLTDTFCYCGQITVGETPEQHDLVMNRATAMVRFRFTDEELPASFARMKFDYTGGSANFNPTTFDGTTKSTQSESRAAPASQYQVYTFPYQSASGMLKMTASAIDADGNVIRSRSFPDIPVTRNKITTYRGNFFEDGDGDITQSGFGFTINADWDDEIIHNF